MTEEHWLSAALGLEGRDVPFPWQTAVVERFMRGDAGGTADIPTGLGKTGVMAAWLVACAKKAPIPRRLVYVVDRRAVVDQATSFAERLRVLVEHTPDLKSALGLQQRALPISTLRGQFTDNREWLEDPSSPAIVVGTVDMVGSRLLFGGYGVSKRMRPYHAGILGADTLFVLDEAHLVAPFERLLATICNESWRSSEIPRVALLALSATGRTRDERPVRLTEADLANPIVKQRLDAIKRLSRVDIGDLTLQQMLVREALRLADAGDGRNRVIVFCNSRETARMTSIELGKRIGDRAAIELLVGERRVRERAQVQEWLEREGFIAGATLRERPAILVATAAGEVGVDLDADHMVSDLVTWERMVQRFGRVNRRGTGAAEIVVIEEGLLEPDKKTAAAMAKDPEDRDPEDGAVIARFERSRDFERAKRDVLDLLGKDASPRALMRLTQEAASTIERATSPVPLYPALTRDIVDAWSFTSLQHDPSRPLIAPWLRGWVDDELQTTVVWRTHLPAGIFSSSRREQEAYFEAAPPSLIERLEAPTDRVADWLMSRARARAIDIADEIVAFVLSHDGEVVGSYRARDLDLESMPNKIVAKRLADEVERRLGGGTLIVDARLCGLSYGLLDDASDDLPATADSANDWAGIEFEVRRVSEPRDDEAFRFVLVTDPNGEPAEWLSVAKAAVEESRALSSRPQGLVEHQEWTRARAAGIADRLRLSRDLACAIVLAARLHDEGKRATRWQRAFRAELVRCDDPPPFAKTRGPVNTRLLDGYRHELGSLPRAEQDPEVRALPVELRDLVLHLIAAHHGNARPTITERGCEDGPPSQLRERTREVARRFMRMQERWGPWGLAWLESLVRAADQLASRVNDERGQR